MFAYFEEITKRIQVSSNEGLCEPDYKHVISYEPIQIEKDLSYEEIPVKIVDRKEQVLRNKVIPSVKVIWRNQSIEEATWELEDKMKIEYPHLFS